MTPAFVIAAVVTASTFFVRLVFFLLHKSTVSHLPRSHLPLPVYFYIFVVLFFCFQHVELTMYLVVLSIFYILYIFFLIFERIIIMNNQYGK